MLKKAEKGTGEFIIKNGDYKENERRTPDYIFHISPIKKVWDMYAKVKNPKEIKSRAVANDVAQKKYGARQSFGFVDNRPEAEAQRRLIALTNKDTSAWRTNTTKHSPPAAPNIFQTKRGPIGGAKVIQHKRIGEAAQKGTQQKNTEQVVQRDLSEEIMVELRKWVREQALIKNIHANHMEALMRDAESLKEGYRTTLEQAKERMNSPAGFKKFEDLSDLTRIAENAIRFGGATIKEVEGVLIYLGKARVEQFLSKGEKVYIKSLPEGDLMKNCHHYAFGGLKGDDALFTYQALSRSLGIDTAESGALIDASQLEGVQNEVTVTVRSYGMPHSAREEGGLVWHKFVNVPCLFAIPTSPDLGNGLVKKLRVTTSKV